MNYRTKLKGIKMEVGAILGQYPRLFYGWRKLFRPEISNRLVFDETEIVIEGFPRSGNTFAVAAFTIAQRRPILIAHHTHKVAQIVVAVKRDLPTMVMIRNPRDAVLSWVIRDPFLSIDQALRLYIRYYLGIEPYRNGFLLGQFEDVTSDFGRVIDRLNTRFGTSFDIFDHTDDNVNSSYHLIESMHRRDTGRGKIIEAAIARPSASRELLKQQASAQLDNEHIQQTLMKAQEIYLRYTEH